MRIEIQTVAQRIHMHDAKIRDTYKATCTQVAAIVLKSRTSITQKVIPR